MRPTAIDQAMTQTITRGYKTLVAEAEAGITAVSVAELSAALGDDDVVIVDLRDIRELTRDGQVPGAFHCPRGMLEFWIDPESPYHKPIFQADKRFIFYCGSGWRSALAAKTAQDMGLTPVAHLAGGFSSWRKAGAPVESVER